MSQQSWGTPSVPASAADQCQKACDDATATVQQLSRPELQNLVDDNEALTRLISDLEKVSLSVLFISSVSRSYCIILVHTGLHISRIMLGIVNSGKGHSGVGRVLINRCSFLKTVIYFR